MTAACDIAVSGQPGRARRALALLGHADRRLPRPHPHWRPALLGIVLPAALIVAALQRPEVSAARTEATHEFALAATGRAAIGLPSALALDSLFEAASFKLKSTRSGEQAVPPLYLASMPGDFDAVQPPSVRKDGFLRALLPLVLLANDTILDERARLLELRALVRGGTRLSLADRGYLNDAAVRYGVNAFNGTSEGFDELLRRVDAVPVSLALAQAALESGWGTSRYAIEGNALFGEWRWDGIGMIPTGGSVEQMDRVKEFGQVLDSIFSYARNLNSHPAYAEFRGLRAQMRADGKPPDSVALAGTLLAYSELREQYVAMLRQLIEENRLVDFDSARLDGAADAKLIVPNG